MLSQHLCAPPSHGPRTSHSLCQGSGKEVRPHPLSYWYVQMSTGLCSVLIHSALLMPALHLVPGDGPSSGDALGLQGTLSGPKSAAKSKRRGSPVPNLRLYPSTSAALGAEGKEPGFWGSNPSPTSCKPVSLGQSLSLSAVSSSPAKWGQCRPC